VLVGRDTASAAEILAGALHANGRAKLVGVQTVGKGAVTQERRLRDGSAIVLVVAHYRLADGRIVEGNGLVPDVEFRPQMPPLPARYADDPVAARRWQQSQLKEMADSVVERAATLLKEGMAPKVD
jgi:C-terminal processing protease CtpA/Prc